MFGTISEELARQHRLDAQRAAAANRLSEQVRALRGDTRAPRWRLALGKRLVRLGVALSGPQTDIFDVREVDCIC